MKPVRNAQEDAAVWARYTSAHLEQGAGRHACNNPSNKAVENKVFQEMQKIKLFQIIHAKFLEIIKPSCLAIDEDEDFDAILAGTHIILLTDNGVYYRLASTSSKPVAFIPREYQPKDLLDQSQHAIYKAYTCDPTSRPLPPNFSAHMAWSQEVLSQQCTPCNDDVLEQDDLEKDLERIQRVEEAQEHDMDIADCDEANKVTRSSAGGYTFATLTTCPLHVLTHIKHKALEKMSRNIMITRKGYVHKEEQNIAFGGPPRSWKDVEADESTLDKKTLLPHEMPAKDCEQTDSLMKAEAKFRA
ncbi:unnamed protein product, partial [Symbiodinium sp. KB8]